MAVPQVRSRICPHPRRRRNPSSVLLLPSRRSPTETMQPNRCWPRRAKSSCLLKRPRRRRRLLRAPLPHRSRKQQPRRRRRRHRDPQQRRSRRVRLSPPRPPNRSGSRLRRRRRRRHSWRKLLRRLHQYLPPLRARKHLPLRSLRRRTPHPKLHQKPPLLRLNQGVARLPAAEQDRVAHRNTAGTAACCTIDFTARGTSRRQSSPQERPCRRW